MHNNNLSFSRSDFLLSFPEPHFYTNSVRVGELVNKLEAKVMGKAGTVWMIVHVSVFVCVCFCVHVCLFVSDFTAC